MNPISNLVGASGVTLVLLAAALVLAFIRLVRGPSLPDRVVALDLMALIAVGIMATLAVAADHPSILDAAIVVAVITFVSTVAFAAFLERGGDDGWRA
ncbi:MAG: hypothetical protein KIT09_30805 [Bryobacteraceae bacterium]|nr:hypothetical protein [Bryobacteraceae bacterium]